ncbi:MAG TPA: dihydropyrimidinase [Anaerolineaceae bacterium]|nr:dihydropyrimidinase [Anaerolineaceae bacterium]
MKTLIKGGTLITASETFQADILIEGEKIAAIADNLPVPADCIVYQAEGKLVMPGGVDVHVHLDLPMSNTVSSDDHYTGTKAAAFGATTTVIDFVSQDEAPLLLNVQKLRAKAEQKAVVDYSFHMNITRFDDQVAEEIPHLLDEGVASVKVFTAYNNRLRLDDGNIFKVMRIAKEAGLLTMLHAENGDVIDVLIREALAAGRHEPVWHARTRPAWGAVEAVLRAASLSAQADAPLYVVHVNAGGEVDQIAYARSKGLKVMGETCPQYLFFTEEDLKKPDGAKWICSPPVRTKADNERIWRGISEDSLQVMSTDHCPFFFDGTRPIDYEGKPVTIPGKELGKGDFTKIPNGLPGLGDRMPVMWTEGVGSGKMSANQFVALHCTNPAKIFGMYPQKGSLLPGSDADIVIWDPNREVEYGVRLAHHRTDYNLYEGWKLKGYPEKVFLRGSLIVDSSTWLGKAGSGRFIYRKPFEVFL